MAPLDQVDHFVTTPYYRPPFSAAAAGEHPRRPRGPVDTPGFITDDVRDACLVPIELEWLNDKICLMEECPVELPEAFAAAWERVKFQGEGCVTVNGLAAEIRSHSS